MSTEQDCHWTFRLSVRWRRLWLKRLSNWGDMAQRGWVVQPSAKKQKLAEKGQPQLRANESKMIASDHGTPSAALAMACVIVARCAGLPAIVNEHPPRGLRADPPKLKLFREPEGGRAMDGRDRR